MTEDERYDVKRKAAEDRLRPLLTDDFLATLELAARTIGWSVDLIEVHNFVNDCRYLAGKPALGNGELEAFEYGKPTP